MCKIGGQLTVGPMWFGSGTQAMGFCCEIGGFGAPEPNYSTIRECTIKKEYYAVMPGKNMQKNKTHVIQLYKYN